jgi:hypothetical protein
VQGRGDHGKRQEAEKLSAKKKAEDLRNRTAVKEMRSFVGAGQAAQESVEKFEDPGQILDRFADEVMEYCRRLKRHQAYFQEKKINPFQRLQIICREKSLKFLDDFDKVAGMKAQ